MAVSGSQCKSVQVNGSQWQSMARLRVFELVSGVVRQWQGWRSLASNLNKAVASLPHPPNSFIYTKTGIRGDPFVFLWAPNQSRLMLLDGFLTIQTFIIHFECDELSYSDKKVSIFF